MPIKTYKFEEQTPGGFNGGEILENRPVVLTGEGDGLQPYSNLFYWAHAWSDKGSTIGEHPHRGFEILSFILKGSIEHYDSKNMKWIPLQAGDVQIIRSGSGISHSEKINAGSEMFQIWFDPDLSKTISMPATYNDYDSTSFPVEMQNGFRVKVYTDGGKSLDMVTPGITIKEYSFDAGSHSLPVTESKIASVYLIDGVIDISDDKLSANDYFIARAQTDVKFDTAAPGRIFVIETPVKVPYRTYAERYV